MSRILFIFGLGCLFLICTAIYAEVVELEGTVKSIDKDARTISVVRKTAKGEKTLELEVAKKAGDLSEVEEGDSVAFSYDPDLEVVTKISEKGSDDTQAESEDGFAALIKADSLDGWHLVVRPADKDKTVASMKTNWDVKDGILTNTAAGRHLASDEDYRDFELMFDFQVPPKCNSGVYVRGRWELKLKDADPLATKPTERCGAIFKLIAPSENAFLGPRKWNKCRIVLKDKELSVALNDKVVIDKKELPNPVAAVFNEQEEGPGPLVLHSHPAGIGIMYRGLRIKRLNE